MASEGQRGSLEVVTEREVLMASRYDSSFISNALRGSNPNDVVSDKTRKFVRGVACGGALGIVLWLLAIALVFAAL